PYTYTPLPTPRSIRLLRIHPRRSRTLHCTLETHTLGDPRTPAYDALSYHWGSSTRTHTILLHSPSSSPRGAQPPPLPTPTRLPVPANCFKALADRASVREPRVVWIDFLCIAQRDAREKAVQLPLMRAIYSAARRTVAWVGDA
ncbi:uncharacterized protein BDZ99DRAFT_357833, partial [Mytilinidion resinicola]